MKDYSIRWFINKLFKPFRYGQIITLILFIIFFILEIIYIILFVLPYNLEGKDLPYLVICIGLILAAFFIAIIVLGIFSIYQRTDNNSNVQLKKGILLLYIGGVVYQIGQIQSVFGNILFQIIRRESNIQKIIDFQYYSYIISSLITICSLIVLIVGIYYTIIGISILKNGNQNNSSTNTALTDSKAVSAVEQPSLEFEKKV